MRCDDLGLYTVRILDDLGPYLSNVRATLTAVPNKHCFDKKMDNETIKCNLEHGNACGDIDVYQMSPSGRYRDMLLAPHRTLRSREFDTIFDTI